MARLDLIDMLRVAGVSSFSAQMSIPYMNMLPRTCEPSAQGVSQLVRGLQHIMNERGADLDEDGQMGQATLDELIPYAGPQWFNRTWAELYRDVIFGKPRRNMQLSPFMPQMKPIPSYLQAQPTAVGDVVGSVTDFATSTPGLVIIGGLIAWKMGWLKKISRSL